MTLLFALSRGLVGDRFLGQKQLPGERELRLKVLPDLFRVFRVRWIGVVREIGLTKLDL